MKNRERDYRVSVMYKAGHLSIWWKWPTPKDEAFSLREKILRIIDKPVIANNCGHFKFSDFEE